MPRFIIERALGEPTDDELHRAALESLRIREAEFPQIEWEHSHVARTPEGLRSYCIYSAPGPEDIREHARRTGLPVDAIHEIHSDIIPADLRP